MISCMEKPINKEDWKAYHEKEDSIGAIEASIWYEIETESKKNGMYDDCFLYRE